MNLQCLKKHYKNGGQGKPSVRIEVQEVTLGDALLDYSECKLWHRQRVSGKSL